MSRPATGARSKPSGTSPPTGFFAAPAGAEIKIRYGGGWIFGKDRQKQTLDGHTVKRLVISPWSALVARMQIRVKTTTDVTYDVEPGDVAIGNIPVEL